MTTNKKNWQKGIASWIVPLVIVILALGGIVYLASKSKPNIGNETEILTIKESDWVRGPRSAKAVLIEYGDFQCPACGAYFPLLVELEQKYPNDLAVVFRHFPLTGHKNALPASLAAQAAGLQGKFWEMHDKIYSTQAAWSEANNATELFTGYAQELGLDVAKFTTDMTSSAVKQVVDTNRLEGIKIGVNSTPTFYLNGKKLADNPKSLEAFAALIEEAIKTGNTTDTATSTAAYHAHSDILVSLSGKVVDFSKPEFQSTKEKELDEFVHFHNNNGKVVHLHKDGKTLTDFLSALKFSVAPVTGSASPRTVLTVQDGTKYIEAGDIMFQLVVNEKVIPHDSLFTYAFKDLDRVFLRFGAAISDTALIAAAKEVSSDACIYSETCPERGAPPEEECVGGLGTACAD